MFKKIYLLMAMTAMCVIMSTGCTKSPAETEGKIDIVCTTFPQYDWISQIILGKEDAYNLTLLLDKGMDLHSYQPTAADIAKLSSCDMAVYVGGESDEWVEDALNESTNSDMVRLNLMEILGENVKEEELVEGMQAEEEHEHEEEAEYDEHVWLSIRNTMVMVQTISDALRGISSDDSGIIEKNTQAYIGKLGELDGRYAQAVKNAKGDTIVVADRFPFRYLVDDYGINYYAAFAGCSAETEAGFDTIVFLSSKLDELGINNVLVIEKSDKKVAKAVIENTQEKNMEILELNSLQSVSAADIENGVSYLSVMEENLNTIKKALE